MGWTCNLHGRKEKVIEASGQKPKGKRSLRGYIRGSQNNIKMHLSKEELAIWIDISHVTDQWVALVNTAMYLWVL